LKGLAGRQQKIIGKRCGKLILGTTKIMLSRDSKGELPHHLIYYSESFYELKRHLEQKISVFYINLLKKSKLYNQL
jgi:hypothetical protein